MLQGRLAFLTPLFALLGSVGGVSLAEGLTAKEVAARLGEPVGSGEIQFPATSTLRYGNAAEVGFVDGRACYVKIRNSDSTKLDPLDLNVLARLLDQFSGLIGVATPAEDGNWQVHSGLSRMFPPTGVPVQRSAMIPTGTYPGIISGQAIEVTKYWDQYGRFLGARQTGGPVSFQTPGIFWKGVSVKFGATAACSRLFLVRSDTSAYAVTDLTMYNGFRTFLDPLGALSTREVFLANRTTFWKHTLTKALAAADPKNGHPSRDPFWQFLANGGPLMPGDYDERFMALITVPVWQQLIVTRLYGTFLAAIDTPTLLLEEIQPFAAKMPSTELARQLRAKARVQPEIAARRAAALAAFHLDEAEKSPATRKKAR